MKALFFITLSLLFITTIYSQDLPLEKDGALLWAENCMGCHIPQNFLAKNPDDGYVDHLLEEIEFNIYDPESGMNVLSFLKSKELRSIATFLIYGSHGEKWLNQGLHGQSASEFGSENCIKCHDNPNLYKEPPLSCNVCH